MNLGLSNSIFRRRIQNQPCKESLDYKMGIFNPDNGTWSNLVSGGDAANVVNGNAVTGDASTNYMRSSIPINYFNDFTKSFTVKFQVRLKSTVTDTGYIYRGDCATTHKILLLYGFATGNKPLIGIRIFQTATSDDMFLVARLDTTKAVGDILTGYISYDGSRTVAGCSLMIDGVEPSIIISNINTLSASGMIQNLASYLYKSFNSRVVDTLHYMKVWDSVVPYNTTIEPNIFDVNFSEGQGVLFYDKINPLMFLTMYGTTTAIHSTKDNSRFENLIYGFDCWENLTDPTKLLRISCKANGDSVRGSTSTISGYKWIFKAIPLKDTQGNIISYPQSEHSMNIPGIGFVDIYNIFDVPEFGNQLYCESKMDYGYVVNRLKILAYSAPQGEACIKRSLKYSNITYYVDELGNIAYDDDLTTLIIG